MRSTPSWASALSSSWDNLNKIMMTMMILSMMPFNVTSALGIQEDRADPSFGGADYSYMILPQCIIRWGFDNWQGWIFNMTCARIIWYDAWSLLWSWGPQWGLQLDDRQNMMIIMIWWWSSSQYDNVTSALGIQEDRTDPSYGGAGYSYMILPQCLIRRSGIYY